MATHRNWNHITVLASLRSFVSLGGPNEDQPRIGGATKRQRQKGKKERKKEGKERKKERKKERNKKKRMKERIKQE
jgi:hypothetical protein